MKPTDIIMDGIKPAKKTTGDVTAIQKSKYWSLLVCAVVLLVSCLTAGLIFFGVKGTKDNQKESTVAVAIQWQNSVIEEKVIGDNVCEVLMPDRYQAVFDYNKDLLLIHLLETDDAPCLLVPFNSSTIPRINADFIYRSNGKTISVSRVNMTVVSIVATDTVVNSYLLSGTGLDICQHTSTLWGFPIRKESHPALEWREENGPHGGIHKRWSNRIARSWSGDIGIYADISNRGWSVGVKVTIRW